MICPRCGRAVRNVWGNGEYPNPSYRCQKCDDEETSAIVGAFGCAGVLLCILAAVAAVLS